MIALLHRFAPANAGGVGIGGVVAESGGGGQRDTDQFFFASWTAIFSSNLLGEARVQVAPRSLTQYANDDVGPRVVVSGVATWGRNTNFPVILDETTTQGSYTLSWQRGSHLFKAGGDVTHIATKSSVPVSFAGSFTFGSLTSFISGTPSTFAQGFGNPQIDLPDTLYAVFVQDSWTLNDRLTLVYGLRYDYHAQPQHVPRDRSNPIEAPLDDGIHRDGDNVASLGVSNPNTQQIGRPYYGSTNRLNALYNNIQMVSSSGWSSYYGFQFTLQERMADGYSLRANYILSESKDDGSDFTQAEQPNDPYNRRAERSYPAEHQRHRVTLTGVWELPYGRNGQKNGNRAAGAAAAVRGVQPVQSHELWRHEHDVGHGGHAGGRIRYLYVSERAAGAPVGPEVRVLIEDLRDTPGG